MPKGPYLLGIDIGGTGSKVGLFTLNGELAGFASREYHMISNIPGQAEQDAGIWWQATVDSVRKAIDGVLSEEILAIGVSNTNGLVPVDRQGHPIRPAIMLWDQRSMSEVGYINKKLDKDEVFSITGNPIAPGAYSLPIILWIKRHEPETFIKTYKFMVPGGYIVARLTGEFTIDHSRACTTLLFDIERLKWHEPFLELAEIPWEKLPDPLPSTALAGEVTAMAAELTGLKPGTPVIAGCTDTTGAAVGSGIAEPGESFIIMGTAGRVCTILDRPQFDIRFMNFNYAVPNNWLAVGAINGVGSSLRWIRDIFGQMEQNVADASGLNVYDLLTSQASKAPVGSKGLLYLPYISGERTPIWDPLARGVFFGITLSHDRYDFFRSVLEGSAFAILQVVELLESVIGSSISEIRIGGTAAESTLWNQIIADMLGRDVISLVQVQTEILGAAILAGIGTGIYEDLSIIAKIAKQDRIFQPDLQAHNSYNQLFTIYKDLYPDISKYFKRLALLNVSQVGSGEVDQDAA
jgi:xylulokinase